MQATGNTVTGALCCAWSHDHRPPPEPRSFLLLSVSPRAVPLFSNSPSLNRRSISHSSIRCSDVFINSSASRLNSLERENLLDFILLGHWLILPQTQSIALAVKAGLSRKDCGAAVGHEQPIQGNEHLVSPTPSGPFLRTSAVPFTEHGVRHYVCAESGYY